MPAFGEVGFTLVDLMIAALNADDTFGTPVRLDYGQELGFSPAAANQELMAYGLTVELLSVVTHFTGNLTMGSIQATAYAILTQTSAVDSGSPVTQSDLDFEVGGSGLPYFGLIGKLAGVNGADIHVGFAKCMLDSIPGFTMRQNEFVMPETSMKMIAPNPTIRKAAKVRRNKVGVALPATAEAFETFFEGFFS